MSVVFDAVGPGSSGLSGFFVGSLTWTHTPAGVPTAIGVTVGGANDVPVSSCTYGGAAVAIAGAISTPTNPSATILGLASPLSGARTVVVNFASNFFAGCAASISVTGSNSASCYSNVSAGATGVGTAINDAPCTSATGELVIDVVGDGINTGTLTPGAGQTQRWVNHVQLAGTSSKAGAPSISMSEIAQPSYWAIISSSFEAAPAATGGKSQGSIFG